MRLLRRNDVWLGTACALTWIALAAAGRPGVAAPPPPAPSRGATAESIDLRPVFTNWGLPPRAQGDRGTCSVFALTGAIEYALADQQRRGTPLSVEFLNWASNQAIGAAADGGYFSDLWKGFEAHGICTEAEMPYQGQFDASRRPSPEAVQHALELRGAGLRMHWIKPWDVKTGLTEDHLAEIKRTLRRQWPVCGGLRWPKQERWKDGVLEMAPPEGVRDGHSVLLVGWRDDPARPGGGVFLIYNSGKGPRDAAMTYEYACAYMNDAVWIDHGPAAAWHTGAAPERDLLQPLGTAPVGRNRRVSSNQQPEWHSENLDMTWLKPHESVEMPLLEGPGVITHIWFTSHAGWVGELNALTLRIYWDGRKEPGVEAPLGDFFAVGQGKPAVVESMPVQVSPTGALTCYWRMPFARSARIVVTNDNPDRSTGLYWQVDWVQVEQLPPETPYFHARYRQEYPAAAGRDYLFADLAGEGFYVGTVLSLTLGQDGWFGEGDDFFYIDGEEVPSLQGTGSEDYFNDAWGFRPRTGHWFGQPRWQGDRAGDSGVCYRWHLPDPVNFTKSLQVTIEHKGNREESEDGFFLERPDFFSSVAFWYQTGEPKSFGRLPPWPERRVPWQQQHLVRAFRQAQTSGDAKVKVETTGFFGARPVLAWPNKSADASLTLPLDVSEDGRYAVRLTAGVGPEYGRFNIRIDDKSASPASADFHADEAGETDLLLGTFDLSKGRHTITFRPDAAAPAQGPKALAVEMARLLRLPPEAKREIRTHHEAHFVRLGIGRAVYAYRLAYDELPDSLQKLVDCGIMPARYLKDENNRPLKSRLEGGFFIVESPAPGGWQHRWQGLDARR
jgi:hypothetical protein